jgi:hypothetical protein
MTRIQIKRGTAASWASANPILSQGEMGYETDTKMIKVGDGNTAWSSLVYSSVGNFGVGSFTQTVGDGSATTIIVTHNLNTRNVVVSVKESSTYAEVLCDVSATSVNAVTLTFATAPTAGQYTVTVIGDNVPVALVNTLPFLDNAFTLRDATDNTKQARFSTSAITTGITRTYVLPDSSTTLVGTDNTQTLTNKTIFPGLTTTATAAETTVLTVASTPIQQFTGTTTQAVVLPTTSVPAGAQYTIINNSTGAVTVNPATGTPPLNVVQTLAPGTEAVFTALVATPTTVAHWDKSVSGTSFGPGKKLTVNNTLTLSGTDGTSFSFPSFDGTLVSQNDTLAALSPSTSATIGVGSIQLGHATDTTLTRSSAGILAVEGVAQVNVSAAQTLTSKTLTNPTITDYTETVNAVGTVTTASTLSLASGTVLTATLTASTACVFTMPSAVAGKSFVLMLKQAATTGSGTATFTGVKWGSSGAPTITAAAGKMDMLSFFSDGVNWYGSVSAGYTP